MQAKYANKATRPDERLLTSGRFSSARELAEALGVSQPVVSNALKILNLPPDEIELTKILFEVR